MQICDIIGPGCPIPDSILNPPFLESSSKQSSVPIVQVVKSQGLLYIDFNCRQSKKPIILAPVYFRNGLITKVKAKY
jgi:hypothetical protein